MPDHARLKKDVFRRGNRMQHEFDEQLHANKDPIEGRNTFDAPLPHPVKTREAGRGHPCEVQEYGPHNWNEPKSPVIAPNGERRTSLNGPDPYTLSSAIGGIQAASVGTKERRQPKQDK